MRKVFAFLVVGSLLFAACAEDNPTIGGTGATATGGTGSTTPATAADCAAADADAFKSSGTLTIGTGNPAFPPWWGGGTSDGSEFEFNDPAKGEGYEGAVAAEVATRMGFSFPDQVTFVPVSFNKSFAPGPKDFDLVLLQAGA
jgi:polar amino acid transport system substrate-binding protein